MSFGPFLKILNKSDNDDDGDNDCDCDGDGDGDGDGEATCPPPPPVTPPVSCSLSSSPAKCHKDKYFQKSEMHLFVCKTSTLCITRSLGEDLLIVCKAAVTAAVLVIICLHVSK